MNAATILYFSPFTHTTIKLVAYNLMKKTMIYNAQLMFVFQHRIHKKIYGKSLMTSGMNGNLGNQIVETAAMLDIQQKKDESKETEVELESPQKSQPAVNGRLPKVGDSAVRVNPSTLGDI